MVPEVAVGIRVRVRDNIPGWLCDLEDVLMSVARVRFDGTSGQGVGGVLPLFNVVREEFTLGDRFVVDATDVLAIPGNSTIVLQAVADFDSDGNKDILIRNSNGGRWWIYTVVGTTVTSSSNVSMTTNLVWSIVAPELN